MEVPEQDMKGKVTPIMEKAIIAVFALFIKVRAISAYNNEDKAEVVFVSTSGKINFTAFSKYKGERLTAAVSRERVSGTAD